MDIRSYIIRWDSDVVSWTIIILVKVSVSASILCSTVVLLSYFFFLLMMDGSNNSFWSIFSLIFRTLISKIRIWNWHVWIHHLFIHKSHVLHCYAMNIDTSLQQFFQLFMLILHVSCRIFFHHWNCVSGHYTLVFFIQALWKLIKNGINKLLTGRKQGISVYLQPRLSWKRRGKLIVPIFQCQIYVWNFFQVTVT